MALPNGPKALPKDLIGGVVVVDIEEERVGSGLHFEASHSVTVGTATAVGVLITTPATAVGIYRCAIECNAEFAGTFTWNEAPNASGGTAITPANNDRRSTATSGTTITHTPTYVSSGTILETKVGGSIGSCLVTADWRLQSSTIYLARFVSGAAANPVTVGVHIYKES